MPFATPFSRCRLALAGIALCLAAATAHAVLDHGKRGAISDGDFPRHFQLITFGYTFCPDICPTTLLEMTDIMKTLGARARHLQPIFISVAPERDTPAHLRDYLKFCDPRIVGATGADPLNYAVDHSAGMYLLAPGGHFLSKFPYGMAVPEIAGRLATAIDKHLAMPGQGADNR